MSSCDELLLRQIGEVDAGEVEEGVLVVRSVFGVDLKIR